MILEVGRAIVVCCLCCFLPLLSFRALCRPGHMVACTRDTLELCTIFASRTIKCSVPQSSADPTSKSLLAHLCHMPI
jgi:hypothetical protein